MVLLDTGSQFSHALSFLKSVSLPSAKELRSPTHANSHAKMTFPRLMGRMPLLLRRH